MKIDVLDTLKIALLVTLVAMLAIIMYRRMIQTLQKGKILQKYAILLDLTRQDNGSFKLNVELPSKMEVTASVVDQNGDEKKVLIEGMTEAGSHEVIVDVSSFTPGKYTLRLKTESQSVSRHFEVG